MGSSDSLTLSSEHQDIGNWFSSYAYESPSLDSADEFKDSGCSKLAEIGESKKESSKDSDENDVLGKGEALFALGKETSNEFRSCKSLAGGENLANKVFENSGSFSLISEPPEVTNWFSSYVYESPALDTCFEFSSRLLEHEMDGKESRDQNCNEKEEEGSIHATKAVEQHDLKDHNLSSVGLIKHTDSFEKNSQKTGRSRNLSMLSHPTQLLSHQILDKKQMHDSGNGLSKDFETSIIKGGCSPYNLNAKFDKESSNFDADAKGIGTISPAKSLRPLNREPGGHDNKENDRNEFAESGFISTRKSKQSVEESSSGKSIKDVVTVPCRSNEEVIATRKVLLETTNLQSPKVLEITGKWRCPQKGKPNLGPPLKQLRLEQWVRRI